MELEKFKDLQHSHCERVVQTLKKKWFPSVLDTFRREGKDDDDEVNASLLSAVSTLMYNQLRGLLQASIAEFVAFFEKFAIPGRHLLTWLHSDLGDRSIGRN